MHQLHTEVIAYSNQSCEDDNSCHIEAVSLQNLRSFKLDRLCHSIVSEKNRYEEKGHKREIPETYTVEEEDEAGEGERKEKEGHGRGILNFKFTIWKRNHSKRF